MTWRTCLFDRQESEVSEMAIYHCSISNVSRAKGSSACATLSYISASPVYEERTAQTYSYGRSERVLAVGTVLPDYAPEAYNDPAVLFNAIENYEKAETARTAKKIEVALPREFDLDLQREVVESYIRSSLAQEGYCAAYAIHNDKENNNPHAHILVANRQIDPATHEFAAAKTRKEYVLDERGERIPLIDPATGQQKTDSRNRKQWQRRTVEQNPLDKKEFLQQLRQSWAVECNKYLKEDHKIDHRSNDERGIDLIPTVHEGYASREIEARGGQSDRAEHNREVRERNAQIKHISDQLKKIGIWLRTGLRRIKLSNRVLMAAARTYCKEIRNYEAYSNPRVDEPPEALRTATARFKKECARIPASRRDDARRAVEAFGRALMRDEDEYMRRAGYIVYNDAQRLLPRQRSMSRDWER